MPSYRKTKYASVYVRHEKGCPAVDHDGAAPHGGPRCRCAPSYRARHRKYGHSPTFKDINEANGWLTDAKRGKLPEPVVERTHELTFSALYDQWRHAVDTGLVGSRRKKRPYRATTLRQYDTGMREHVLPVHGATVARLLTIRDWQSLVEALHAKGLSTNSINCYLNPVREVYAWACSPVRELLPANATVGIELPPSDEVKRDRVASPAEFRGLLAVLPSDDQVLWAMAGYAGMRSSEIEATDWSNVDFDQGGIFVPDSKSEAGVRWTPMVAPLRLILSEAWMRAGKPASGRVLIGRVRATKDRALGHTRRNTLDKVAREVARALHAQGMGHRSIAEKLGTAVESVTLTLTGREERHVPGLWERHGLSPIGLHECRHTFNSYCHAAGVPLKVQAQIVGHEDETMSLKRYTHTLPGQVAEAAVRLDAYLGETA